jgi:hypothetical protein
MWASRYFSTNVRCRVVSNSKFQAQLRLNITASIYCWLKDLVPEPSTNQIYEALEFSRFRFKLIEFLKLPFDIREPALREVLERTCGGVYRNYLARAGRIERILQSEDALKMNVRVPLAMDKRQSASQNQATSPVP